MSEASAACPVTYDVEPQLTDRNRLTCFFRFFLTIPHLILVGGPGLGGVGAGLGYLSGDDNWFIGGSTSGGRRNGDHRLVRHPLREQPPAGPARLRRPLPALAHQGHRLHGPAAGRVPTLRRGRLRRLADAAGGGTGRPRQALGRPTADLRDPHFIALLFVGFAWAITAIIAWFAIRLTGSYRESLSNFGGGYLRWSLRVESYMLLLHDEYPPFSRDEAGAALAEGRLLQSPSSSSDEAIRRRRSPSREGHDRPRQAEARLQRPRFGAGPACAIANVLRGYLVDASRPSALQRIAYKEG